MPQVTVNCLGTGKRQRYQKEKPSHNLSLTLEDYCSVHRCLYGNPEVNPAGVFNGEMASGSAGSTEAQCLNPIKLASWMEPGRIFLITRKATFILWLRNIGIKF